MGDFARPGDTPPFAKQTTPQSIFGDLMRYNLHTINDWVHVQTGTQIGGVGGKLPCSHGHGELPLLVLEFEIFIEFKTAENVP